MAKAITVRFIGDTAHLKKAFNDVGSESGKFGAALGKLKVAGVAAAAAVGAASVKMGIDSVKGYSDQIEALNKVNEVFGTAAAEIDKFASTSASKLGISRTAALDAAGGFGNLFDQLEIGKKQSMEMTTSMVQLSADFASFHNADITQVLDAQSAAFRGEYDALQRFLPLIKAATVEEKALAMTGKESTKEITEKDKALAVYQMMLDGVGKAQGDFARTSDGMANAGRILQAGFVDTKAALGGILVNDALPALIEGFGGAGKGSLTAADAVQKIRDAIERSIPTIVSIAKVIGSLARIVTAILGPLLKLVGLVLKIASVPLGWVGSLVNGISKALPGRAGGGPVTYGRAYVVGESGPELFTPPPGGGSIVPNGRMGAGGGGSTTYVANVNVQGSVISERELERVVHEMLRRRVSRGYAVA